VIEYRSLQHSGRLSSAFRLRTELARPARARGTFSTQDENKGKRKTGDGGQDIVMEVQDMRIACEHLREKFEKVTAFDYDPQPLDMVQVNQIHAPSAMEDIFLREEEFKEQNRERNERAAQITRFIRFVGSKRCGKPSLLQALLIKAGQKLPEEKVGEEKGGQKRRQRGHKAEKTEAAKQAAEEQAAAAKKAAESRAGGRPRGPILRSGPGGPAEREGGASSPADSMLSGMMGTMTPGGGTTPGGGRTPAGSPMRAKALGVLASVKLSKRGTPAGGGKATPTFGGGPVWADQPDGGPLDGGVARRAQLGGGSPGGGGAPQQELTEAQQEAQRRRRRRRRRERRRVALEEKTGRPVERKNEMSPSERMLLLSGTQSAESSMSSEEDEAGGGVNMADVWQASRYAQRLQRQVKEMMVMGRETTAKHVEAAAQCEEMQQQLDELQLENSRLRQSDYNPWPVHGTMGGPLFPRGQLLARPEHESDCLLVYDREVNKNFSMGDVGVLTEGMNDLLDVVVDMYAAAGQKPDAKKVEQLVCDSGGVVVFVSKGCLNNWYCVLAMRAALAYGKKIILTHSPKYFPDQEARPIDLVDLFVEKANGAPPSVVFHRDFPFAAAQTIARALDENVGTLAGANAENESSSEDEEKQEHLKTLGISFRACFVLKRSSGRKAAECLKDELEARYRCFADLDGTLRLHQLKKMVTVSSVCILLMSQDILTNHWCISMLARAKEKRMPVILIRHDSFPPNLPASFPPDARAVESLVRTEWDRMITLETKRDADLASGAQREPTRASLDACVEAIARRLGPSDLSLETLHPFVEADTLRRFFTGELRVLSLAGASIGSSGTEHLCEGLRFCASLEVLQLAENHIGFMAQQGLVMLGESLKYQWNPRLHTLGLARNELCGQSGKHFKGLRAILDGMAENHTVTNLDLSNNLNMSNHGKSPLGLNSLSEMLRLNRALVVLDLSNNALGAMGCDALARGLDESGNQTLAVLILRHNLLGRDGNEGVQRLADSVASNQGLTYLDMACNFLCDGCAQALAGALHTNCTVTALDVSRNDITPEGVPYLAAAVRDSLEMAVLDIRRNDCRKRGAKTMLSAVATQEKAEGYAGGGPLKYLCGMPVSELSADTVQRLDLSGAGLGICEAVILTAFVEESENLRYLNVEDNDDIRSDYKALLREV
jgi:Ran GTPase-activating protein (RanGAP) involved in mRNA processing and transport